MKNISKILLMSIFCILISAVFSRITVPPENKALNENEYKASLFLGTSEVNKCPQNSLDVVFFGSSNIYCDVIPIELWDEYGIPAYNAVSSGQCSWTSYYYLREVLKHQKPKAILVDMRGLFHELSRDEITNRSALDHMPFSFNKLRLAYVTYQHQYEGEDFFSYIFPAIRFHSRWNELTRMDYVRTVDDYSHGYDMRYWLESHESLSETDFPWLKDNETNESEAYESENADYYKKMAQLCKDNNIRMVVIKTPVAQYTQEMHNAIQELADESNVEFVDFNSKQMCDAMGYDFTTDMMDREHMNYRGAHKFTKLLGKILVSDYGLSDHRGDDGYSFYDNDLEKYKRQVAANDLHLINDASEYIKEVSEDNYQVIWTCAGENKVKELIGVPTDKDVYQLIWNCTLVKKDEDLCRTECTFDGGVKFISDQDGIFANGKNYCNTETGIGFLVYDRILEQIVDYGTINTAGVINRT